MREKIKYFLFLFYFIIFFSVCTDAGNEKNNF
jgi:hypothetical protein